MKNVRIAAVQYELSTIEDKDQFWNGLISKIREAAGNGANLIIFPEYVTSHLLSLEPVMTHLEACLYLEACTAMYVEFFQRQSQEWNVTILGGTHICKEENEFFNQAFMFFPDGRIVTQKKLHLTPEEQSRWPLAAGDELQVFETEWGKISILICYDIEFPELARNAAERGAELILCPSYTDTAAGYHRVRFCSHARAIENQLFVALSGLVGHLQEERPQVDSGYCLAGVFTPCDFPFAEDGIIQIGDSNRDMIVYADVDFSKLSDNRLRGAVAPFYDRRPELYMKESIKKSGTL
jgi:predicted amidohydrolase